MSETPTRTRSLHMSSLKKAVNRQLHAAQTPTDTPGWWTAFGVITLAVLLVAITWNAFKPATQPGTYSARTTTTTAAVPSSTPAPTVTTSSASSFAADTATSTIPATDGHSYAVPAVAAHLATLSCQALYDSSAAAGVPWTDPAHAPAATPDTSATVSGLQLTSPPTSGSSTYIATVTTASSSSLCTRELTNTSSGWKVVTPL